MRHFDLGEVIAFRKLQFRRHDGTMCEVVVNLGKPVLDPQNPKRTWMCPYQILGIGSAETKAIFGADTMQALILALHTLPAEVNALATEENGSFVPVEDQNLGLNEACRVHLEPTA